MRYVGIDIASETHVVAAVDGQGEVLLESTPFGEDASGYTKLLGLLGEPRETLVAMEATGHYWKNLVATLLAHNFGVALLIPFAPGILPSRIFSRPRPMPSMRWGSPASRPRSN